MGSDDLFKKASYEKTKTLESCKQYDEDNLKKDDDLEKDKKDSGSFSEEETNCEGELEDKFLTKEKDPLKIKSGNKDGALKRKRGLKRSRKRLNNKKARKIRQFKIKRKEDFKEKDPLKVKSGNKDVEAKKGKELKEKNLEKEVTGEDQPTDENLKEETKSSSIKLLRKKLKGNNLEKLNKSCDEAILKKFDNKMGSDDLFKTVSNEKTKALESCKQYDEDNLKKDYSYKLRIIDAGDKNVNFFDEEKETDYSSDSENISFKKNKVNISKNNDFIELILPQQQEIMGWC